MNVAQALLFFVAIVHLSAPQSPSTIMSSANTTVKDSGEQKNELSFKEILDKSAKSAVRGGTAGACAMGANVACLMWMRTTVCLCVFRGLCVYSLTSTDSSSS